mmetsp:Transcript_19716/g.32950  ORF Transcript_19716/g.32950 Transcript_19716/m.32950 type:complete len:197 (+) Transcript_19716:16-606(+)
MTLLYGLTLMLVGFTLAVGLNSMYSKAGRHCGAQRFIFLCKRSVDKRSITKRYLTTNIIVVGKKNGVEDWISEGYAEYEKRLKPTMKIQTTFLKNDDELIKAAKSSRGYVVALDEKGNQFSSKEFSSFYYTGLEKGGATVSFLIGGFAGLPEEIRSTVPLISLSKMTWTHSMARLLLIEQIYRAVEIHKGSGYHKD